MFCTNCGKKCNDNDRFCGACGHPLTPVAVVEPAPAAAGDKVYKLYFDAKGLTLFNYKFEIKDETGNVRYKAETVSESMIRYNAKLYDANDQEVIKVSQQSKMTFAAMNFDFLAPDGQVLTDAMQKMSMINYTYTLGSYGITLSGNFIKLCFDFVKDGKPIAHVDKKFLSWGDCYEISYSDPALEQILLASVLMIQLVVAAQRRRRH